MNFRDIWADFHPNFTYMRILGVANLVEMWRYFHEIVAIFSPDRGRMQVECGPNLVRSEVFGGGWGLSKIYTTTDFWPKILHIYDILGPK